MGGGGGGGGGASAPLKQFWGMRPRQNLNFVGLLYSSVGQFWVLSKESLLVVPLGAKWSNKIEKMILIQKPMRTTTTHLKILFSKNSRGQKINNKINICLQYNSSINLLHSKTFEF